MHGGIVWAGWCLGAIIGVAFYKERKSVVIEYWVREGFVTAEEASGTRQADEVKLSVELADPGPRHQWHRN